MSAEDMIDYRCEGDVCVVCGKSIRPGEVLATMHQKGSKLPICCPLCLEAYQADSKLYLERLARRIFLKELHAISKHKLNAWTVLERPKFPQRWTNGQTGDTLVIKPLWIRCFTAQSTFT